MPSFTGLVLTGGRSSRMGTDKAFLVPGDGGPPLVQRAVSALLAAGADCCVAIGGDRDRLAGLGIDSVVDDEPGAGPLAAVVTGLRRATTDLAVVLSCDLPAVDAPTVRRLVDELAGRPSAEAAIPLVGGHLQVLTAAYRTRAAAALSEAYDAGERSLRRALTALPIHVIDDLDPRRLVDLDQPSDIDHYARGRIGDRPADAGGHNDP